MPKSLVDINKKTLGQIANNITNNANLYLFDHIHNAGLSQEVITELIPPTRKNTLEQFVKAAHNIPSIETSLTVKRINPFTEFEKSPPLFFGIGGGSQMLCKGLPFDVLLMILTGEKLRRLLNLGECRILMANRITYTNISHSSEFSKESIDRVIKGERDLLQIVLEKLKIQDYWKVILQSDLERIIGSSLKKRYEHIIADADSVDFVGGHHYSIEMADIWALVGQKTGGIKLSWFIRKPDKACGSYIMDEQPFDARFNLYTALRNEINKISFAYTPAGARLFSKSVNILEKVPPYICYYPKRRLLLSPFENAVEKLANATQLGGGFNFKFIRSLFRNIAMLFEEIVLGEDAEGRIKKIPTSGYVKFKGQVYAERIEYILQFIFSDTPDAKKIWNKSFLKI